MPSPSPNTWRATRRASSTRSPSRALALRWSACCMTSGCARRSRPGASHALTGSLGTRSRATMNVFIRACWLSPAVNPPACTRNEPMPEMHFRVKWPSGQVDDCYSPSYIVEEHLSEGTDYDVEDFVSRVRTALSIASERVFARYGFECSSALDQLRAVEATAEALAPTERVGKVKVLSFTKHAPRDARAKKPEHFSVVVVGGGQAGLSMSYLLKHNGISHVVLEGQRIASAWRSERWDAFCLVTPNWQ